MVACYITVIYSAENDDWHFAEWISLLFGRYRIACTRLFTFCVSSTKRNNTKELTISRFALVSGRLSVCVEAAAVWYGLNTHSEVDRYEEWHLKRHTVCQCALSFSFWDPRADWTPLSAAVNHRRVKPARTRQVCLYWQTKLNKNQKTQTRNEEKDEGARVIKRRESVS